MFAGISWIQPHFVLKGNFKEVGDFLKTLLLTGLLRRLLTDLSFQKGEGLFNLAVIRVNEMLAHRTLANGSSLLLSGGTSENYNVLAPFYLMPREVR